jgi:transposase
MPPANPTPVPPAAELNQLHNTTCMTYRQMAAFYGVGLATIRRWMDEQNVPRLQSGKRPAELAAPERRRPSKAELERMYADGMNQKQIAVHTGFSKSTINTMFRDYGIVTRVGTRTTVDIASAEYEFLPDDLEYTPDPTPFPPPRTGKSKAGRSAKRPWLRLSEMERKIVGRAVDEFLIYAQMRKAA